MSVQELTKNKKYKIDLFIGKDNKGKIIRHIETFNGTLKEARLKENELKLQLKNNGSLYKSDMLFSTLTNEYLEIQKNRLSPTTYKVYQIRIPIINSKIGNIKLKNINTKVLDSFYSYLKNDYISKRTNGHISNTSIQHYYAIINNIFEQAIKWDYIKENPNKRIEKPKRDRNEIQVYSKEEVFQLLECLKNEPLKYQVIVYMALDLGLRLGELVALTWNDINFNTREIIINKSVQMIDGKTIEKETKSLNSDRKIYMTTTTLSLLKKYRAEQKRKELLLGNKWIHSNRVLTTEDGNTIHHDTPSRIFQKLLKKYNLRHIKFHALRHTNASLKIQEGVQHQIISRSLGHSSVQITDRFYSHFYEEEFKDMSNILDNKLFSKVV